MISTGEKPAGIVGINRPTGRKGQDGRTLKKMGWVPMKLGFRGKIYAGIISVVLLSGLLMAFSVRTVVSRALSGECKQRGVSLAVNLAARSEDAILAVDFLRMKNLIDEVVNLGPDISYAFIQDREGQTLAHTFKGGFPIELETAHSIPDETPHSLRLLDSGRELIYDIAAPVFVGDHRLGTVRLGLSKTRIGETIRNLMLMIFLLTGISILIAALVGAGFADRVIRTIKSLHQASEEALEGNLDVRTAPPLKKHCWEIRNCNQTTCPAFGNRETRCWYLGDKMWSEFSTNANQKTAEECTKCPVRRRLMGDELQEFAVSFDAMVMALKNHIAQLKASEENLEKSEKKYRSIFEGSMDLIFLADTRGTILDINEAGLRMLGYAAREDFLGSATIPETLVAPEPEALFEEIFAKGFIQDQECTLRARGGSELKVLFSGTTVTDVKGEVTGFQGIIKDITQRKNMEQQLLQAEKLASLGQLSAGVAHEINNPLGLILGYTQLMLDGKSNSQQQVEDLKTIEKHTRNCKRIVEALMNFARRTETKRAAVDINRSIREVLTIMRHQLELEGLRIETSLDENLPPVQGDSEKLKQVFMNLILNSRQAITGPGEITLSSSYLAADQKVMIQIHDTGSGIKPEFINKVFDPFFTTKPIGQGTGLGLSLSYGIVKEHSGDLLVTSDAGKGSTFSIVLPLGSSVQGLNVPLGGSPKKGNHSYEDFS
jgi:two-component system NtrC family sensor kinase